MNAKVYAEYKAATSCRTCANTYSWNGYCDSCIPRCDHGRQISDDCGYCG